VEKNETDQWIFTSPVGSFPENGYGLFDMAVNLWEYCQDWYFEDYYKKLAEQKIVKNPKGGSEPSIFRVMRGGGWYNNPGELRSSFRNYYPDPPLESRPHYIGFRCVKNQ